MSPDRIPVPCVEHERILSTRTHLREARHIRGIYYWLRDGTTFDDLPVAYASSV